MRILLNQRLWGKDFPRVLATTPAWMQTGEQTIQVFSDRIVSTTGYATRAEAEHSAASFADALRKALPRTRPEFDRLQKELRGPLPAPTTIQFEDDRFHVVQTAAAQLLAPGLTIAVVREQLGREQQVIRRLIQNERERRPIVLTLHVYAGGTAIFAEADVAPPGTIDRVLLNTSAVSRTVFVERP